MYWPEASWMAAAVAASPESLMAETTWDRLPLPVATFAASAVPAATSEPAAFGPPAMVATMLPVGAPNVTCWPESIDERVVSVPSTDTMASAPVADWPTDRPSVERASPPVTVSEAWLPCRAEASWRAPVGPIEACTGAPAAVAAASSAAREPGRAVGCAGGQRQRVGRAVDCDVDGVVRPGHDRPSMWPGPSGR